MAPSTDGGGSPGFQGEASRVISTSERNAGSTAERARPALRIAVRANRQPGCTESSQSAFRRGYPAQANVTDTYCVRCGQGVACPGGRGRDRRRPRDVFRVCSVRAEQDRTWAPDEFRTERRSERRSAGSEETALWLGPSLASRPQCFCSGFSRNVARSTCSFTIPGTVAIR